MLGGYNMKNEVRVKEPDLDNPHLARIKAIVRECSILEWSLMIASVFVLVGSMLTLYFR